MKKLIVAFVIAFGFGIGFWYHFTFKAPEIPRQLTAKAKQLRDLNEKLISSEILSRELDLVAKLVEQNLATSSQDSLADDANMPFMNFMTDLLRRSKIELIKLEPGKKISKPDYVRTPYVLIINASYRQFGDFVNTIEKSERLITVEDFDIDNDVKKVAQRVKGGASLSVRTIQLKVSTLTLIKKKTQTEVKGV
ncbi:MAG: type 4a pilus biogenesis protein PilO [bacterium]|nr:type 4a pilus biogenesis protein PilO [bacterium]